ncbi:MAG: DNA polymerase III subunit beta [Desulfatitalea sp.]|nr:DNA polymerase III subunit beta [Desulfatitalea sp.]NNK02792.1 DNA polymerase III subunit beta [Desulfatitalea sp.]
MKFSINKNEIVDVLGRIQGLTGRRSSLAITECIRIQAKDNEVHLTATDLETCFEGVLPATVHTPGTIAISARRLYDIAREFPIDDILVEETENRWINISDTKVHYHLMGMNPEDFPEAPIFEDVDFFELPSAELKRMIEKSVVISGIGEDKKPHINGVLFERLTQVIPCSVRMVSTDGSRLSKFDLTIDESAAIPEGPSVLIPKKGLSEVNKFLGGSGAVKVGIQESYFIVQGAVETLAVRMLEGKYPPYDELVLRKDGYSFQIDKAPFNQMLKRMSILCTDNYRAAIFTFENGRLIINATNPDIGESNEDMAIDYDGEKMEAAFNPRFFIDALSSVDDDKLILNIVNNNKPCLIEGAEDKTYLSAIMPMRV